MLTIEFTMTKLLIKPLGQCWCLQLTILHLTRIQILYYLRQDFCIVSEFKLGMTSVLELKTPLYLQFGPPLHHPVLQPQQLLSVTTLMLKKMILS